MRTLKQVSKSAGRVEWETAVDAGEWQQRVEVDVGREIGVGDVQ